MAEMTDAERLLKAVERELARLTDLEGRTRSARETLATAATQLRTGKSSRLVIAMLEEQNFKLTPLLNDVNTDPYIHQRRG